MTTNTRLLSLADVTRRDCCGVAVRFSHILYPRQSSFFHVILHDKGNIPKPTAPPSLRAVLGDSSTSMSAETPGRLLCSPRVHEK